MRLHFAEYAAPAVSHPFARSTELIGSSHSVHRRAVLEDGLYEMPAADDVDRAGYSVR